MNFQKPPLSLFQQLDLLESRGLVMSDRGLALSTLTNLGYYRLSGYSYPFRKGSDREGFKVETSIEQIIRIYEFDRQLRLLVSDAIERIEIGIRSRIINESCLHHQLSHWFTDSSNFHRLFNHRRFIDQIEKSCGITYDKVSQNRILPQKHPETFIEHYYEKYTSPYLPPFWMVAEVLTMGSLSHLYKGIGDSKLKAKIAKPFGVPAKILVTWFHAISHLRNICAHHGRLWNRVFSISPTIAKIHRGQINDAQRFEGHAATLLLLLNYCSPHHTWSADLQRLISEYPEIDVSAMGFTNNWQSTPLWNSHT